MVTAVESDHNSVEVVKVPLNRDKNPNIAKVIIRAAQSQELLELLLGRETKVDVTKRMMIDVAWLKLNDGGRKMKLLLNRAEETIAITEGVLEAVARNQSSGKAMMEVLLGADQDIQITELVLIAALENLELIMLLCNDAKEFEITESLLMRAAAFSTYILRVSLPRFRCLKSSET